MKLAAALHERFATWALRTRPPEAAPIVLTQRRVYVLPTRAGLAYAVVLFVMLLGAANYNLSLGHAMVFLLVGLGFVAIFHTYRNLVGLSIDTGRAEPVFLGEAARFALLLQAEDEHRRLGLTLPGMAKVAADVVPGLPTPVTLEFPAGRRGWLPLPRVTVETSYPLGLVRAWSYAAPDMRCLVYPRPAADAPPLPHGGPGGSGLRHGQHGAEDFAGLRSHQPQDPPRHVAWKIAARLDSSAPLQTKQFAGAAQQTLWLDWNATPAADTEARLSLLTRWVLDAAAEGLAWGLRLPGTTLPPGLGEDHLRASLKALALHELR